MAGKATESPRPYEAGGPGLGVDPQRISPTGTLLTGPDGDAIKARWLGKKVVLDNGESEYPKIRVGEVVYYKKDFIYVTPDAKLDDMDTVRVEKLVDKGCGSEGNRRQIEVRWMWRPSRLAKEHSNAPEDTIDSCAPNEVFWTDTTTEISADCIEGLVPGHPCPHATPPATDSVSVAQKDPRVVLPRAHRGPPAAHVLLPTGICPRQGSRPSDGLRSRCGTGRVCQIPSPPRARSLPSLPPPCPCPCHLHCCPIRVRRHGSGAASLR